MNIYIHVAYTTGIREVKGAQRYAIIPYKAVLDMVLEVARSMWPGGPRNQYHDTP